LNPAIPLTGFYAKDSIIKVQNNVGMRILLDCYLSKVENNLNEHQYKLCYFLHSETQNKDKLSTLIQIDFQDMLNAKGQAGTEYLGNL
jgi:hypothetical protein